MFDSAARSLDEPIIDSAPRAASSRPLLHLWLARVRDGREPDYRAFAVGVLRPLFQSHAGCGGVTFLSLDARVHAVITQWHGPDDVVALQLSPSYSRTVERIIAEGLIEAVAPVALWPVPPDIATWSRTLAMRVGRAIEQLTTVAAPEPRATHFKPGFPNAAAVS